jgi:predicted RNA-binding protein
VYFVAVFPVFFSFLYVFSARNYSSDPFNPETSLAAGFKLLALKG